MKSAWRNVSFVLAAVSIANATLIAGCNKQKPMDELNSTVQQAKVQVDATGSAAQSANKCIAQQSGARNGDATPEDQYETVFAETVKMLDEDSSLQITSTDGVYIFTVLNQRAAGTVVCHDTDATLSFAKCCRDWVKGHGCIVVTTNSGGWNSSTYG